MIRSLRRIVVAIQFLTRVSMPRIAAEDRDFAASIRWFPIAGLVVGFAVFLAGQLGSLIDPWAGALLALLAWVAVTGALHLDGLADFSDAMGAAHKDRDRFVEILADPHIGSFGVIALVLQLAAKLVLLHAVIGAEQSLALLAIPAVARLGPLVWAYRLPPLSEGLGSRFAGIVRGDHIGLWLIPLTAAALLIPAFFAAPLLILGWSLYLRKRVGGVSGDCHGAGIELVETGLLLALVITRLL